VLSETNTARAKIEEALAATAFEPQELERAEERLFALRALARKHRVGVDDLPAFVARLETELAALDQGETKLEALTAATVAAREVYADAAMRLSESRKAAAERLDAEVAAELAPLKLDKARLITRVETVSAYDGGPRGIVVVLSDEIYSRIYYGEPPVSIASFPGMLEKTIILDGFSKTYAAR